MNAFLNENFLLTNPTAITLYEKYASKMPIIDYHCHIPAKDIAEDVVFHNITEIWLGGDHYKWRLMRAAGIEEKYITGDASDYDKFTSYVSALETAIGNPLYHFSHLELKNYFDYNGIICQDNADEIWEHTNKVFAEKRISARSLMLSSNVKVICTTDDPIDSLEYHKAIADDASFDIKVLPSFRPDRAMLIRKPDYADYIGQLAVVSGIAINNTTSLKEALVSRLDFFVTNGCRVTDHGLDFVPYNEKSDADIEAIFAKAMKNETCSLDEESAFQTYIMKFLFAEYTKRGLVVQLHYGCSRNNNSAAFNKLGADTGFDCIGSQVPYDQLIKFLDSANDNNALPKTILYSLNPNDNAIIDTIMACFQDSSARCKLQHGSAWWFNDHKPGIASHLETLAAGGLLSGFVGMLTDSRSFVSYARHEYFRRILCNYIGTLVENGEYPNDEKLLKKIVDGICYDNAAAYFQF